MNILEDFTAQLSSYYDRVISSLPTFIVSIILTIVFAFILYFVRKNLMKLIRRKAEDPLLVNFLNGAIRSINMIVILLLFLVFIGKSDVAAGLFGAAGLSAVVIGFAFKDIAENFLAGVIMAFKRPFRVGDTIMTEGVEGNIISMSLRDSQIKTFDGKDVFVPNAQILKNPLYNYTIDGFLRKSFTIGIDYDSDINQARSIILEVVRKIDGVLNEQKAPKTLIGAMTASTINIDVQYWIDTFDKTYSVSEIHSQAINKSLKALAEHGVNMPGDIVELKNYYDQPLQTKSA